MVSKKTDAFFRRHLTPMIFVEGDFYGDGPIFLNDQAGTIYTPTEAADLLERLSQFYSEYTDEMVEEINQQIEEAREERAANTRRHIDRQKQRGFVYLILNRHTGNYKVGVSKNVEKRLKSLNSAAGGGLELVYTIETPDMRGIESELHDLFAEKRVKGEWFDLDQDDVAFIKTIEGVQS